MSRTISNEALLKELLSIPAVSQLILEVKEAYRAQEVNVKLTEGLSVHGAFVPGPSPPVILINPKTGLTAANIAHELVHALQLAKGFPLIPQDLFTDKRNTVVRELNSNILHIPLVGILAARGIGTRDYLEPTLLQIDQVLSSRIENDPIALLPVRMHYEAAIYLRLEYEGAFLSKERRGYYDSLFATKSPTSVTLAKEMIEILGRSDPSTPRGNALALLKCLRFLNGRRIGDTSSFQDNLYEPCLRLLESRYLGRSF